MARPTVRHDAILAQDLIHHTRQARGGLLGEEKCLLANPLIHRQSRRPEYDLGLPGEQPVPDGPTVPPGMGTVRNSEQNQ